MKSVYEFILEEKAAGKTAHEIARSARDKGYRSRTGRPYMEGSIAQMLTPTYRKNNPKLFSFLGDSQETSASNSSNSVRKIHVSDILALQNVSPERKIQALQALFS